MGEENEELGKRQRHRESHERGHAQGIERENREEGREREGEGERHQGCLETFYILTPGYLEVADVEFPSQLPLPQVLTPLKSEGPLLTLRSEGLVFLSPASALPTVWPALPQERHHAALDDATALW